LSYESIGERILKIGPHLLKLLSNVKGLTFWDTMQIFTQCQEQLIRGVDSPKATKANI